MKEIIIAIIGSGALSALISAIASSLSKKKGIDKAVQMLLLGEIKAQGRDLLKAQSIGLEDLQAFNELYTTYKAMGGNGYAETIHNKVNALPVDVE